MCLVCLRHTWLCFGMRNVRIQSDVFCPYAKPNQIGQTALLALQGTSLLRCDTGTLQQGESTEGTAPSAALRTRREPLGSPGSHHPAVGFIPICQCGNSRGCLLVTRPSQYSALRRWHLNLLNFRIAHLTRVLFRCCRVG
jgi:hypothetical protein